MLAAALAASVVLATPAVASPPPASVAGPRVVIAVLPFGTSVEQIAAVPELAPGVVSAGLGPVGLAQTFLDIGQGNRVNEKLYDRALPPLRIREGRVPAALWQQTLERAASAPANIVPGLLGSTVVAAGVPVTAEAGAGLASLIGVDRDGVVPVAGRVACAAACRPGLSVVRSRADDLAALADRLGPDDLLIAIAAGASGEQLLLPTGIAGEGFAGNLTSASTRTDGVVLSTDIAPTVLGRLGIAAPDEINGTVISSSPQRDPPAVAELQARLDHRPSRNTVVLLPLGIWIVLTALGALAWRRPGAQVGLRMLALSCAWAPLLLLVLAAPDAGALASALTIGLGGPALALASERLLAGCAGLALACAATVGAYAVDVIAGSPLSSLSVLGPNPGGGVRFFGIGNELEAILTTLTLIGTGAWLETRRPLERRPAALWFVGVALAAAAAFAPGRFGADVGAAIVLGVGAATAAALALGLERRRAILVVVGGGALALAGLFGVDLLFGGAHLSRSVFDAGGTGDLIDVLDRRVSLMIDTFIHPVYPELLAVCVLALIAGAVQRHRVSAWFGDRPLARCGYLGALAGVLVGTVANDSGSVLLVIGTVYLVVAAGFFWATVASSAAPSGIRQE